MHRCLRQSHAHTTMLRASCLRTLTTVRAGLTRHVSSLPQVVVPLCRPESESELYTEHSSAIYVFSVEEAKQRRHEVLKRLSWDDYRRLSRDGGGKVTLSLPVGENNSISMSVVSTKDATPDAVRAAIANAARAERAKSLVADFRADKANSVLVRVPDAAMAGLAAQALLLGSYAFDRHLTKEKKRVVPIQAAEIVHPGATAGDPKGGVALARGSVLARDIANERSEVMTPLELQEIAKEIALVADSVPGVTARVHVLEGEDELLSEGLGMLHAVGQAASRSRPTTHGARVIALEITREGEAPAEARSVLCLGKGLTFDSGGLNLKPTGSIETMHMDKGGAAAVLGAAYSVLLQGGPSKAGVPHIFAVVACENAIGSQSYKPHAILRSHKGITVQVGNTDAEGRLALADGLSYLQKRWKPGTIVDVATLTGACVIALGQDLAGLFSNSDELVGELGQSAKRVGEPLWRMPLLPEHTQDLKCDEADLNSTGKSRGAGASTAAAFLQEFVEEGVRWAHLDIAGAGMRAEPSGISCKGGTGFGAQILSDWIVSGRV
jgi:leucyl aminopeptidase